MTFLFRIEKNIVGKGDNAFYQHFIFFPLYPQYFQMILFTVIKTLELWFMWQRFDPFPKRQLIDSSKLKEFADDNFKFEEKWHKVSKRIENTVGKKRNCSLHGISPFPTLFSKDLFGKGLSYKISEELTHLLQFIYHVNLQSCQLW